MTWSQEQKQQPSIAAGSISLVLSALGWYGVGLWSLVPLEAWVVLWAPLKYPSARGASRILGHNSLFIGCWCYNHESLQIYILVLAGMYVMNVYIPRMYVMNGC